MNSELDEKQLLINSPKHQKKNIVDDVLGRIGFGFFQVIVFVLAGLCFFSYEGETLTFTFVNLKVTNLWNLTSLQYAILPSATSVSNIAGAAVYSVLADRYGRVWPLALCLFLIGIFMLVSAFSTSFALLVVFRALASVGIGALFQLVYAMLIESVPVNSRGRAGLLVVLIQTVGSFICSGVAWWIVPTYTNGWRIFIIITSVPFFIVGMFRLLFYCQSPRYLVGKGKVDEAWNNLRVIAKMNCKNVNDMISENEFKQKTTHLVQNKNRSTLRKFMTIFKPPYHYHTICLTIVEFTQNTTYYGTTYFFPVLLKNLGVNPYFCLFIGFASQIPGVLLMSIIIEWPIFGRLNAFRLFTVLAGIFFFLFAFIQTELTIPLFMVFLYFAQSPLSPLLSIYVNEIYPTEIRTMANTFVGLLYNIGSAGVMFLNGYLADLSKTNSWIFPVFYGGAMILQLIVSIGLRRETRGKDLQDLVDERLYSQPNIAHA